MADTFALDDKIGDLRFLYQVIYLAFAPNTWQSGPLALRSPAAMERKVSGGRSADGVIDRRLGGANGVKAVGRRRERNVGRDGSRLEKSGG
jgi:hypothetical protein